MARKNRMKQYEQDIKDEKKDVRESADSIGEEITETFKVKQSKPLMKDTHHRTSFLFRKDLRERLDVLSDYYGRGFRTHFLNNAIENAIISAEQQMKKDAGY